MSIMYCELCERPVDARRRIGPWTWILGFFTIGASALAIPLYRKRCPICRSNEVTKISRQDLWKLRNRRRREELEDSLDSAVDALDSASSELERTREERDFYRKLSDPRKRSERLTPSDPPKPSDPRKPSDPDRAAPE